MLNILLVDDSDANLKSLKLLLKYTKSIQCKVSTSPSVKDAVSQLRSHKFDVVVSDRHLEDGSGEDIKSAFPKVPFVYVTGDYSWNPHDGSPVVHKPFLVDKLLSAIKSVTESMSTSLAHVIQMVSSGELALDEAISNLLEVSPPGFSGTTKAMKDRHSDKIDNPWALSWWMYKKGAKPHKAPESDAKGIKKYIPPEEYAKRKEKRGEVTKVSFGRKRRLVASMEN